MKQNRLPNKKPRSLAGRIALALLFIALVAGILYYISYRNDKSDSHTRVQSLVETFNLGKEPVHQEIRDEGCSGGNRGLLGYQTVCSYYGAKLYRGKGTLSEDLHKADAALRAMGYQRDDTSDPQSFEDSLSGTGSVAIYYFKAGAGVYLEYYTKKELRSIQDFFGIKKDIPLLGDEYVYGIYTYDWYWMHNWPL